jgi:hypothetical protein
VTQCMNAGLVDASLRSGYLDSPQQIAGIDSSPELSREYQTGVGPLITGAQPFRRLSRLLRLQQRNHAGGERHRTS